MENESVERLEEEMVKFCKILRKKVKDTNNFALMLTENGIIELIMQIFDKYKNKSRICILLNQIISNLKTGNIYKLFNEGCGTRVLNSMRTFKRNKYIQAQGCSAIRALVNIKFNALEFISDKYKAHEVILSAMKYHVKNVNVQKAACSALWCLLSYDEDSEFLWNSNIPKALIKTLKSYPEQSKIQEYGIQALNQFHTFYTLARLGAAEIIVKALEIHKNNSFIVLPCLEFIRNLCNYKSNTQLLQRLKISQIAVNSLMFNLSEEMSSKRCLTSRNDINIKGCIVIFHLSGWEFMKPSLFKAKVSLLLKEMIKLKDDNDHTFNYLVQCLEHFVECETFIAEFISLKLFESLIDECLLVLDTSSLSKREHIGHLFDILYTSCMTCNEVKKVINKKIIKVIKIIEEKYSTEDIFIQSNRLKLLLTSLS